MSKRRKPGDIVMKSRYAGFVGAASLVVIQSEDNPMGCMMECGDPKCVEWETCLECDAQGNLLGGVACHVSECQMSDAPAANPGGEQETP
jgi:hypothetical protein